MDLCDLEQKSLVLSLHDHIFLHVMISRPRGTGFFGLDLFMFM